MPGCGLIARECSVAPELEQQRRRGGRRFFGGAAQVARGDVGRAACRRGAGGRAERRLGRGVVAGWDREPVRGDRSGSVARSAARRCSAARRAGGIAL